MVLDRYKEEAEKEENKLKLKGMKMDNRSCTDVICCFLFTAFTVLMIAISVYGYMSGDPKKIFTPFDSDGNMCGYPNQRDGRDFSEYPYKYFPDLFDYSAASNPKALLRAVCVKKCPNNENGMNQDCQTNRNVTSCPESDYETTVLVSYCVPEFDSAKEQVKDLYASLDSAFGLTGYIVDI